MKQIPLKAIERQSLSVMLEGELYDITLKECNGSMAMAIKRGELTILDFRRVCAGIPVIPRGHSDMGNFIFTSFKDEFPYFNRFESSDQLFYVTMEELATIDPDKLIELATPLSTPLVKLDASVAISLPNYLTLNRDSLLSYVNRDGVVVTASADQPGFEVDGLLIEGESTNLIAHSEALTNAAWSKLASGLGVVPAITSNYAAAPNGSMTADRCVMSNTGTTMDDYSTLSYVVPTVVGGQYSISVWLKSNVAGANPKINLSFNGEVIQLITVTDKWQRFTVSNPSASDTSRFFRLQLRGSTGSSTSADLLVWGAQEEHLGFPTSLMITTGVQVTRAPARLTYQGDDAEWMYRKFKPYNGAEVKELVRYSGDILPSNFYGHLKELILWNREPTAREKAELGV